ncbi:DNA adenine methylase [Oerskovia sp. NPDC056781]|uniref:DNA adenine methylase n=1 Tax=Oerskovia sp. NPDC056781 TaxID=3345942 RepID=UPI00367000D3
MRYVSPLRYPGGKARLAPFISSLIEAQDRAPVSFAEPFAGGAGAALRLLVDGSVEKVYLNDLNLGIASFWRAVFEEGERLAQVIETTKVDLDTWRLARDVYQAGATETTFELGFATFLLNRCNRSGILDARPIGGFEQNGTWKIDARYNHVALAARVRKLWAYRDRVSVSALDGREFLTRLSTDEPDVLVYVDPPYLVQGERLYLDSLSSGDHARLAKMLKSSDLRWFLTYDVDSRITEDLYQGLRAATFDIAHTAQRQHVGEEIVVFSNGLIIPDVPLIGKSRARWDAIERLSLR